MLQETFNGETIFSTDGNNVVDPSSALTLTISLTGQTMSVSRLDFSSVTNLVGSASGLGATSATIAANLATALNNLASLRATNGSEQNRMGFASDLLEVNKTNLEAANSRIVDLDVATEMVSYSKYKFLEEANLALLAQANTRSEKLLKLLE
jgi:flagellin